MRKSLLVLGYVLLISLLFVGSAAAGESSLNQGTWNTSPTTSPAVIQNTSALVEPTTTPIPTIRLNEVVMLSVGSTFSIAPINNLSSSITVNRTSALGALDAAATAGNFDYTIKTTDWGPFINSIGDYTYNETTWDSWLYMVNGVTAEVGAADYNLTDGDLVTYWYGAWGSSPATSPAVVTIYATIPKQTPTTTPTTIPSIHLNETVTLAAGSTFSVAPINNHSTSITVNRTSALGALDAAATAGKFDYTVKTTDWGPFINSIGEYTYNETTWDSWLYMVNGATAEVGAADYTLTDGDLVTYWYGAWGSSPATSPAVVTINVAIPKQTPTPTPTTTGPVNVSTPYKTHVIPGTIQAEDYDLGGEGVTYHDTTPGNEGGAYRQDDVDIEVDSAEGSPNVGWIRNGEYLTYTATVQSTGAYTMAARVASPNSGRTAALSVDGVPAATIAVPNTGSFSTFGTVSVPVTLTAGTHTLKVTFSGDGQNLNWLEFTTGAITTPTTTPTQSGGDFTAMPRTAPKGTAVKFSLTPASGRTVSAAWWTFDRVNHYGTWNSRDINPTFFYPAAGTFSPLVKITYTDGSTETVTHANSIQAT